MQGSCQEQGRGRGDGKPASPVPWRTCKPHARVAGLGRAIARLVPWRTCKPRAIAHMTSFVTHMTNFVTVSRVPHSLRGQAGRGLWGSGAPV